MIDIVSLIRSVAGVVVLVGVVSASVAIVVLIFVFGFGLGGVQSRVVSFFSSDLKRLDVLKGVLFLFKSQF